MSFFWFGMAHGQDIIHTLDGRAIEVNVTDVGLNYIEYVEQGDKHELPFKMSRKLIEKVEFQDPLFKAKFEATDKEYVVKNGNNYEVGKRKRLKFEDLDPFMKKDSIAYGYFINAIKKQQRAKVSGVSLMLSLSLSSLFAFASGDSGNGNTAAKVLLVFTAPILGAFTIVNNYQGGIHKQKALDRFGVDYLSWQTPSLYLEIGATPNGLGLVLNF